ncbi:MAG: prepilin-type N-terminal cleavage/methylation domain-containing protein [Candidatus Hydrogenedentes bacterium]|nr:prepilin-type N-terminal cleavage/methylation domain-containing protein [Candidatus Hydrogenedentota bacterium]
MNAILRTACSGTSRGKSLHTRAAGMTLMEVMMAVAIFTIVMGALFAITLSIGDTARVQDAKLVTNDEARRALQQLVPELRQAASLSINWTALPGQSITYQIATDLDGNGAAVDVDGALELSAARTVKRDFDDENADGITATQLVLGSGDMVRVLANNIAPENEGTDVNGVFGPTQDTNGNGRQERGFWIEARNGGLEVSIQAQGETRQGQLLSTMLTEFVAPRN